MVNNYTRWWLPAFILLFSPAWFGAAPGHAMEFGSLWPSESCAVCGKPFRHTGLDIAGREGDRVLFRRHMRFFASGYDTTGWKGYVLAGRHANTFTVLIFHLDNIPVFAKGEDLYGKTIGTVANLERRKTSPHLHLGYRKAPYTGTSLLPIVGALPDCPHEAKVLPEFPEHFLDPSRLGRIIEVVPVYR